MVNCVSAEVHKRNTCRVYYSQFLEKVYNMTRWTIVGGHSRVQAERERKDLGHMLLLSLGVKCFGDPRLRLGSSIQTQRSRVLVSSTGVLLKRCIKGRPWDVAGRLGITEILDKVTSEITFVCDSVGCYLGQVLA